MNLRRWYRNLSVRAKLLIAFLGVGLLPFTISSYIISERSAQALEKQIFGQLAAIREAKKSQIETFFNQRKSDLDVLGEAVPALQSEAFSKLLVAQALKRNELERYFRERFALMDDVQQNPRFTGGLQLFTKAFKRGLNSREYRRLMNQRDSGFATFNKQFGFYDLFLIDSSGNVVYSQKKQSDLGANVSTGALKSSGLADLFDKARSQNVIVDYGYSESSKELATFIATPLKNSAGAFIGVAAFQIWSKDINAIVQAPAGPGSRFETYLAGEAGGKVALRSDRLVEQGKAADEKSGPTLSKALAGGSGKHFEVGSGGQLELVTYEPINIPGLHWAMLSTSSVEALFSPKEEGGNDDYFKKYINAYGYDNLLLIDPKGYLFYTVIHGADYQTNLVNGQYSSSNLGGLVRKVLETKRFGFADFARYPPLNDAPASFVAQPIIVDGKVELIVALQLSLEAINSIMQDSAGLGNTGETYLVGPDFLMRSDSIRDQAGHSVIASFASPAAGGVKTDASRGAISGQSNEGMVIDYNGNNVLSAYAPLDIFGVKWGILAEINESEAFQPIDALRKVVYLMAVVVIVVVIGIALMIAGAISGPIIRMAQTIGLIAENRDLTLTVPVESSDEIGAMSESFNNMMEVIHHAFQVISRSASDLAVSAEDLAGRASGSSARAEEGLTRADSSAAIITEMDSTAELVSESSAAQKEAAEKSSETIHALLSSISKVANLTELQNREVDLTMARVGEMGETVGKVVATAQGERMEQVSESVKETIKAVEEMSRAVEQATEHGRTSLKVAGEGRQSVGSTAEGMRAISESSEQLSEIIDVITEIAEQANLLALNAGIEAARAGAHGKGFSVVADEVGKLARHSSEAVKEMTPLIKDFTARANEGTKLTDELQQSLVRIDQSGQVTIQAIDAISKTAALLTDCTSTVEKLVGELNVDVQEIGKMAGEQGQGRQAAQNALESLLKEFKVIGSLAGEVDKSAKMLAEEMTGIANRTGEMTEMTDLQAERSKRVANLSNASAEEAKKAIDDAQAVAGITSNLEERSAHLNQQLALFKIDKKEKPA